MKERSRVLWTAQNRHPGDRKRLFGSVRAAVGDDRVLYPGSFVDISPSFLYPPVTDVDTNMRTQASSPTLRVSERSSRPQTDHQTLRSASSTVTTKATWGRLTSRLTFSFRCMQVSSPNTAPTL